MLHAEDVSAEPSQLAAYVLIGIVCGGAGVLFVHANERWSRFKSRHARARVFRNRYIWSTAVILLWAAISYPRSPWVGSYMCKGQLQSVDELFASQRLSEDWHAESASSDFSPGLMGSLISYVFFRFSLLVVGISLPLPCGVFAPSLAIGAGIGRIVGEIMRVIDPDFVGDVLPGGCAPHRNGAVVKPSQSRDEGRPAS